MRSDLKGSPRTYLSSCSACRQQLQVLFSYFSVLLKCFLFFSIFVSKNESGLVFTICTLKFGAGFPLFQTARNGKSDFIDNGNLLKNNKDHNFYCKFAENLVFNFR